MIEYTISIDSSGCAFVYDKDNKVVCYLDNYKDIYKLFSNQIKFETPLVNNAIYVSSNGQNLSLVQYFKASKVGPIHVGNDEIPYINVPDRIYVTKFTIDNDMYTIASVSLFTIEDQILTKDSKLFIPELPNVYNNGEICLGYLRYDLKYAKCNLLFYNPDTIFFSSSFNRDLFKDIYINELNTSTETPKNLFNLLHKYDCYKMKEVWFSPWIGTLESLISSL